MYDDYENGTSSNENEEKEPVTPTAEEQTETSEAPEAYMAPEAQEAPEAAAEPVDAEPQTQPESQQTAEEPQPTYVEAEKVETPNGQTNNQAQGQNQNPYSYGQPQYQGSTYQYQQYNGGYQNNGQYSYQQPTYQPNNQEPKKKNGKKIFLTIVAIIVVFALGVGTASIFNGSGKASTRKSESSESEEETTSGDDTKLQISESPKSSKKSSSSDALTPSEIAAKVRKSNVGVMIYSKTSSTYTSTSSSASGEGSGIVMGLDSTGQYTYIITCAHVIDDSDISVKIQTEDGDTYDAEIVGYDTRTDVGVLKVNTNKLQAAEFGDSEDLSIGDPVYAMGNPGGTEFFGSFTGGYISAINRPVSSEIGYTMNCIQHDAAINPGNSGGMLVNQYGQVVGINSQKIASSSYEGMGFAIPITDAKEIIDDLIEYGYVPDRAKLGITYYPVSASTQYYMIAQLKGLPAGTLIINEISSDSSLADTKVQKYDMITAVNGKDLDTADTLLELIDNGKVGDKLTLTICRVNSNYTTDEFDVDVTLVEDKGTTVTETTTEAVNPFDYYYNFGNGNN